MKNRRREMKQNILKTGKDYREIDDYIKGNGYKHVMLVCDEALGFLKLKGYFDTVEERLDISLTRFDHIQPNPLYEGVVEGVEMFRKNGCDAIIAVGGGSVMDTAKGIKLYARMDPDVLYLEQEIVPNDIPLAAVPTTAGTGSEATRYAAIYYNGVKQSVTHESAIPQTVFVDPSVLATLPEYQKKATAMDALCHCIESYWSVNSNDESFGYSDEGIRLIMENIDGYIANDEKANEAMLYAANLAGKAINITQTTAGHAMCYKLTSLYGTAHGHAAALCTAELWPYMTTHMEKCIDERGEEHLQMIFEKIAAAMGCDSVDDAIKRFAGVLERLDLRPPVPFESDYEILKTSVNPVRLGNFPVKLDEEAIDMLYHRILSPKMNRTDPADVTIRIDDNVIKTSA